jgi:hypothetical protein
MKIDGQNYGAWNALQIAATYNHGQGMNSIKAGFYALGSVIKQGFSNLTGLCKSEIFQNIIAMRNAQKATGEDFQKIKKSY